MHFRRLLPLMMMLVTVTLLSAGCTLQTFEELEGQATQSDENGTATSSSDEPSDQPATISPEISMPAEITLPPGFTLGVYADNVPGARSMTLSPDGTLFVGTNRTGSLYAVVDHDQDHHADEVFTLATGMFNPNGVAFRDGSLYVAEINRILRYDNIEENLSSPPPFVVVNDEFPSHGHHGWKFIRFGPDGKLYVPIGAPCNTCETAGTIYGAIMRMNADGSDLEMYVQGVRNSVGFDWDPQTEELWFTDNGRDLLGDDLPPDELNHVVEQGMHFGFPYCHGGIVPDPAFGTPDSCDKYTPPAMALGPHVAALGMRFYTGDMFPEEYRNQIIIAEHGSWNRTTPIGYGLSLVSLEDGQAVNYETFAEGWHADGKTWGRPVDVLVMPDGSLLVSDDAAGMIYRITYAE